jgi:hypothetical protein
VGHGVGGQQHAQGAGDEDHHAEDHGVAIGHQHGAVGQRLARLQADPDAGHACGYQGHQAQPGQDPAAGLLSAHHRVEQEHQQRRRHDDDLGKDGKQIRGG